MTWQEETIENLERNGLNIKKDFKDWIRSKTHETRFFDPILYHRAHWIQKSLYDDYDSFTVITGMEGSGKSTLSAQLSAIVSPSLKLNNICYEIKGLIEQFKTAKKGDTLIMDEGGMFLFSRESMSETNRILIKLFMIARQRNLHMVICIPNFFTLDTYIREHRVKSLIEIQKRGHYRLFIDKSIKLISAFGKKYKTSKGVKLPSGTFHDGYFNKPFPIINDVNFESYQHYKNKHYKKFIEEMEEVIKVDTKQSSYLSIAEFVKEMPMSANTVKSLIDKGELKAKKMGKKYYIHRDSLEINEKSLK